MNIFSAWRELTSKISVAGPNKIDLFEICSDWCVRHKGLLSETDYHLESFVSLNCGEYIGPTEVCTPDELPSIRALTLSLPKQHPQETAARRLRDALEALLAVKSTTPCASCGSTPLYAEAYLGGIFGFALSVENRNLTGK